jgi:hypothetical protein
VTALLGPLWQLSDLVPGAVVAGTSRRPRAGWIGTALDEEGTIARVAVVSGEVEIVCGGKVHRITRRGNRE